MALFAAGLAQAQIAKPPTFVLQQDLFTVEGELKIEGEGRPQDYTAEIEPCRKMSGSDKSAIEPNGQFEFRGLVPDCYVVRILLGQQSKVLEQKTIQVGTGQAAVQFTLRRDEQQTQPAAGYVALQELASPPSKKAVKAFQHAQKDAREGKLKQAAEQYRQILQSEPKYAEAHQELGALYLQMGQAEPARAEFVAARGLGLESPAVLGSLALALLQLGRVEESEAAAREALAKEPTNAPANYALGSALLFHSTDYPLILEHLARAAEQIPSARLLTAKVRAKTGDIKGAIQDLTEYLRVCPADKRAAAEGMLRELQAQLVAARR
jgi:tetratricopeptide (TPR) repeat protein